MADTYLPAFHACVAKGRASGIMCSYNSVNGVPSCANGDLLNGLARCVVSRGCMSINAHTLSVPPQY